MFVLTYFYTLLVSIPFKALPRVSMENTAQSECQVASIAARVKLSAIFVTRHSLSAVFSYKRSGSALSVLLYFTLKRIHNYFIQQRNFILNLTHLSCK